MSTPRRTALPERSVNRDQQLTDRLRIAAAALAVAATALTAATGRMMFVALALTIAVMALLLRVRLVYLPVCALLAFTFVPVAQLRFNSFHGTLSPGIAVVVILAVRTVLNNQRLGRGPHAVPLIGLSAWMGYRALFSSSVSTSGAWLVAFVGLVVLPALILPGWNEAQRYVERAWLALGGLLGLYSMGELALSHNPLLSLYPTTGLTADTVYRVTTTFGNPLLSGLFFCIAAFIGFGGLLRRVSVWSLVATGLSVFGVFATSSRGSAIALGAGLLLLLLLRLQRHHRAALRRTVVLFTVVIVGLSAGGLYLLKRADSTEASGSTEVRLETFQAGDYLVAHFWLWGAGPGLTDEIKYQMPYGNYQRGVESSAYEILIELGLPGVVLFCWVLLSVAASAARQRPELTAAVLAYAISASTFDLLDEFRPALLLFGLLLGVAAKPNREDEPPPRPTSDGGPARALTADPPFGP